MDSSNDDSNSPDHNLEEQQPIEMIVTTFLEGINNSDAFLGVETDRIEQIKEEYAFRITKIFMF